MTQPRWLAIASICYVGTVALVLVSGMPAIAVALQASRGLSNDQIGWLATSHIVGLTMSSAACPYLLRFMRARQLLTMAVLLVLAGLVFLALYPSALWTCGGFVLCGIGAGVANAII